MKGIDFLLIGGSFPLPHTGGSVNYVYNILSEINKEKCVVLTANLDVEDNKLFDSKCNYRIIRNKWIAHVLDINQGPFIYRMFKLVCAIFIISKYIINLKPKVIFFTDFTLLTISYIIAKPFINSKLGIFTFAEEIQLVLNRKFHLSVLKKILKDSNAIITVCDYTRRMICGISDSLDRKITIIIPPVNVSKSVNNSYSEKGGNSDVKLLTVARLEERKGHVDVLIALKELVKKYPNVKYTIVGKGSFEKEIEDKIIELGLEEYVDMKGRVSDQELLDEYKAADIFVMPHKQLANGDTEGCPTVFLEAGLYSIPVVGGEAGGVSDAILDGKTGYICHVGTNELYEYLEKLISSSQLRESLGLAGRQYASQFSIQSQSKKFDLILQGLFAD